MSRSRRLVRAAVALGILAACVSCSPPPQVTQEKPIWEYLKIDPSHTSLTLQAQIAELNKLGSQGWELIGMDLAGVQTLKRQK